MVRFSEQLSSAVYFNNNLTVTSNAIASPDGYQNADMVTTNNSAQTAFRLYETSSAAGQSTGTVSAFMKYANHQYCYISQDDYLGITKYATFDLINGTNTFVSSGYTATITPYANGWYRVTLTGEQNTIAYLQIGLAPSSTGYAGTSIPDGQSAYFWGIQREYSASYATSYIPTLAAATTRGADAASKTGISSLIGQTEGVAYVEFDPRSGTGERRFLLQIGSGSTTIYARIESGETFTAQILNGGTDYLTSTGTSVTSGINKFAVAYANNDAVFYLNGTQLATSSSVVVPSLSALYIGANSSGAQQIGGDVNQALLFKTRFNQRRACRVDFFVMAVVYLHRKPIDGSIFYVGIGNKEKRANHFYGRNAHWNNTYKKYGVGVEIVAIGLTREPRK